MGDEDNHFNTPTSSSRPDSSDPRLGTANSSAPQLGHIRSESRTSHFMNLHPARTVPITCRQAENQLRRITGVTGPRS